MGDWWLEKELSRQLAPVAAPDSLWDRIQTQPRTPRRRISLHWALLPVAAALVLLALSGVLRSPRLHRNSEDPAELAAFAGATGNFDFRSADLQETRAWVKTEANIDIDMPVARPANDRGVVRVLGARLIRLHGSQVAAIDYRAGDETATLFVSGKRAGLAGNTRDSRHLFSQVESAGEARLLSWNMRDQTYTIAFSGARSAHAACLLCHATTPS
jgi:hypothetical protein